MWESQIPCRVQTQPPESLAGAPWWGESPREPSGALYVLNREKSIRQTSPFLGGKLRLSLFASHSIPFHENANSTLQPWSRSSSLLIVPSIDTAVFFPGNVQSKAPSLGPRGWVLKPTPLNGLSFDLSNSVD